MSAPISSIAVSIRMDLIKHLLQNAKAFDHWRGLGVLLIGSDELSSRAVLYGSRTRGGGHRTEIKPRKAGGIGAAASRRDLMNRWFRLR
jgi:hypothetical protein